MLVVFSPALFFSAASIGVLIPIIQLKVSMTSATPTFASSQVSFSQRTIRPIGAAALHGIACKGDTLIAIDTVKGHLLEIDPTNDNTKILNPQQVAAFVNVTGLAFGKILSGSHGKTWFITVV